MLEALQHIVRKKEIMKYLYLIASLQDKFLHI